MDRSVEIRNALRSYYDVFFGTGTIYGKLAKAHGLTSSAFFVLQVIHEPSGLCTQSLICEKLLYPKQTVNAILNAFEDSGYIERKTASGDRRNKEIQLTQSGWQYAAPIMEDLAFLEEGAFLNMDPAALHAMLEGERAFLAQITRLWDLLEQKKRNLPQPDPSI